MKTIKKISLMLLCTALIFNSCKKDEATPAATTPETAPDLPPSSSFIMNTDSFPQATKKMAKNDSSNVAFAALNVGVWNVIIALNMVVPTVAFLESFNHPAVNTAKGEWKWTYTFNAANAIHSAELKANLVGDSVKWQMHISKQNDFTNVLWYSGSSALNGTAGNWTLNKDPHNVTPFVFIEWHKNSNGTSDIKYTNIIPKDAGNGGYIKYGITNVTPYDAFYTIYGIQQNNLVDIKWSRSNRSGRVQNPAYFKDSLWHCWNTNLANARIRYATKRNWLKSV